MTEKQKASANPSTPTRGHTTFIYRGSTGDCSSPAGSGVQGGVKQAAPQRVCSRTPRSANQVTLPPRSLHLGGCTPSFARDMAQYLGVVPNKDLLPELLRTSAPQFQADLRHFGNEF